MKFCFYIFLFAAFNLHCQTPFDRVRRALDAGETKGIHALLDSCRYAKYHGDSVVYYDALANLKENNLESAHKKYSDLAKNYPEFYLKNYLRGLLYFRDQDYGKSIESFSRVLDNDSTHYKSLLNRALAAGLLEDYDKAIEDLSKCIAYSKNNRQAIYARAYWYEISGKLSESAKDYEMVISHDPQNFEAYLGLANVYHLQKNDTKACEVLQSAVQAGSQIAEELKENYCHGQN